MALNQSQADMEFERAALVTTLHDDLGGLLVAAIMDQRWISRQPGHSAAVREKLDRVAGLLHAAVDMERQLIEGLRPTLLDTVGLFSTLRWHLKASCEPLGIIPVESYPPTEAPLSEDIKLGVFRIFQEALKHVLAESNVWQLTFAVNLTDNVLQFQLTSEHERRRHSMKLGEAPPTFMHHRARRLGGDLQWLQNSGGHQIEFTLPLTSAPD
jgi:signal transduction histidine kinase